jgi:hypothetical protein
MLVAPGILECTLQGAAVKPVRELFLGGLPENASHLGNTGG